MPVSLKPKIRGYRPRKIPSAHGRNRTKTRTGMTVRGEIRFLARYSTRPMEVIKQLGPGMLERLIAEVHARNHFLVEHGFTLAGIRALEPMKRRRTALRMGYVPLAELIRQDDYLHRHGHTVMEIHKMKPELRVQLLKKYGYLESRKLEFED